MKTRKLLAWMVLFTGLGFTLLAVTAPAQDSPAPPNDQAYAQDQPSQDQNQPDQNQDPPDPPGRVGRLNYIQGSVSFRPAGEDDWVTAVPTPSSQGAGVDPADQPRSRHGGGHLGTRFVVRVPLGHRGISQGPKDRLRHRGLAIHFVAGYEADDRLVVGGGGDAAEPA